MTDYFKADEAICKTQPDPLFKAKPESTYTESSTQLKVTLADPSSYKNPLSLCLMHKKQPTTFFLTKGLTHWQFCQLCCKHYCHVRIIINFVYCS